MNKLIIFALLATLAAAQEPAAAAADPTTINLKPVLRPAFRRNAAGEYDVPATATTDYGNALQSALAKWAGVNNDAVAVTPGTPVIASKPGTKVVEAGVTCAGPNVCMPFEANIKAGNAKAATKLRDALSNGKLDNLSNELKRATGNLKAADGTALPGARGFNLGSVDGKASSRNLDLASLNSASKKGLSKGAIAGIVIGSILGALLLAGLLWALCNRRGGASATTGTHHTAATTGGNAKLGTTGAAATTTGAAGGRAGTTTTTTTTGARGTTAADAKLGGTGARSGNDRGAAVAGTTTTTTTTTTTEKPQSGLAKLASTLSGKRSKSSEVADKVVDAADRAADAVKDAANRV